ENCGANTPSGTMCSAVCQVGFVAVGAITGQVMCSNGSYVGGFSGCASVSCPALPPIVNGVVAPIACTTSDQPFGRVCLYTCNPGFTRVGSSVSTCTQPAANSPGEWSDPVPSCVPIR